MIQETPVRTPGQTVDSLLGRAKFEKGYRLLVWDRSERKLRDCGPATEFFADSAELAYRLRVGELEPSWRWFAGTDVLMHEREVYGGDRERQFHRTEVRRFNVERGAWSSQYLDAGGSEGGIELTMHPARSMAFEVSWTWNGGRPRSRVRQVDAIGRISGPVDLGFGIATFEAWVDNGDVARIRVRDHDGKAFGARRTVFYDVVRGELRVYAAAPAEWKRNSPPSVEIRTTLHTVQAGVVGLRNRILWLSAIGPSERPAAMISANGENAKISPRLDGVAVLAEGIVHIRPLAVMNRSAMEDALRVQAVQSAKQVGMGMLLYAGDWDDQLPLTEMDLDEVILPYLKSSDVLRGFVYLHAGGLLREPGRTMLGYIPSPGGHAVVFGDGRVEWRLGPPPRRE